MTASLVLHPSSTALRPRSPSSKSGANAAPDLAAHLAPHLPPSLPRRTLTPSPAFLNKCYPVVTDAEYLQNRGDFTLLWPLPTAIAGDVAACWAAYQAGREPVWSRAFSDVLTQTHWVDWRRLQDYHFRDLALVRGFERTGQVTARDYLEAKGRVAVREKSCLVLMRLFLAYIVHAMTRNVGFEDIWPVLELFEYTERPTLQERQTRFLQTFGRPNDSSLSAHPHAD
ncbi:hypothetical protein JCM10213_001415 [Rhodosporidiobolus nylandii]